MLDWLWGAVMAGWVIVAALWIMVGLCRIFLGNLGTSLLIVVIALSLAWAGWLSLIHSHNSLLQGIGWSVAVGTVLGTLKTGQFLIRKFRDNRTEVSA